MSLRTGLPSAVLMISLAALLTAGCGSTGISPDMTQPALPETWQTDHAEGEATIPAVLETTSVKALIKESLDRNYQLAQQREALDEARLEVTVSGADRYPLVSLNLDASRQKNVLDGLESGISDSVGGSLDISWELDIWGKLSDRQKRAQLTYQATRFGFARSQQQLATDVATAWLDLMAANQLLTLYKERLKNLDDNLDIIENGYRRGIYEALDVYLTRNTVAEERSRVANQSQLVFERSTALQRLLARYPDGKWHEYAPLPDDSEPLPTGLPADLLTRRQDIQQAWATLLAADADLALAHKARFPSFNLVASGGSVSDTLKKMVEEGNLGWSLLGSISQPLFAGKRLQAEEAQAESRLRQAEKAYLDTVFTAMAETETAISNQTSLTARFDALVAAQKSATAAYELSLQQYRRGLTDYITVLESQRRAFDAQTSLVQVQNALLDNRISLYLALGGNPELAQDTGTDKDTGPQT